MSTLRAFIVEDSPVILKNLTVALEELADLEVVGSAASEADAVRELAQLAANVDLVIVDVFLAQGSGLGVLRYAQGAQLAAPRVVLTNYATPDMQKRCLELGADRVFDKSKDLDELFDYCEKLADA